MRMQKLMVLLCFICIIPAQTLLAISIEDLLKGYAENDIELQELSIIVQQTMLDSQKVFIENGINVALSTGTIEIDPSQDIILSPELQIDFPFLNNSSIYVQTPIEIGSEIKETHLELSTDIISYDAKNVALKKEEAERSIELSTRNLKNRALAVEENFWTELQSLYTFAANVLIAEDDLIEEQVDFDLIEAQGYTSQSATYRTKELEVKTSEWTVEEAKRVFDSELKLFLVDCGFSANAIQELPSLPESISNTEIISIMNYDSSLYETLDESLWNASFNEKHRSADSNLILSAEAGFDYEENAIEGNENNVSLGLNADWLGFSIGAGFTFPTATPSKPSFTIGLAWDMNTMKLQGLSEEEKQYEKELDELSIEKAQNSYDQLVQTALTEALDLEWQKQKNEEELYLYEELYNDTQVWYNQGIVSALDLLQAKTNYEKALSSMNATLIDILIYNLNLSQQFIGE